MTVNEAATLIGCSPVQVRVLIRNGRQEIGRLKAVKRYLPSGQWCYDVDRRSAERFRDHRPRVGYPRGRPRGPAG